jgi:hypothetical protein
MTEAGRMINTLILCSESNDPGGYLRWMVSEGHRHLQTVEQAEAEGIVLPDADVVPLPDPEDEDREDENP